MYKSERGQGLVEFSLVLPIFLMLLMGIVDFGRVIWANDSLANAAREGARLAIVHGGSDSTACPIGPIDPNRMAPVPAASGSCPYPSPSKQSIKDAVTTSALAAGRTVNVTVCYGSGCSGDTDTASDGSAGTNKRGTPLTVRVTSTVDLVVPSLLGLGSFGIAGSSTMIVNH
jgi:Flp pilus assembly protein TadG